MIKDHKINRSSLGGSVLLAVAILHFLAHLGLLIAAIIEHVPWVIIIASLNLFFALGLGVAGRRLALRG